jgi:hypothetical protein
MSIRAGQITRVIIDNEWFSVELGTFEVVEMVFTDNDDEPIHDAIATMAYRFRTPNNDRYYGPLSAISLFKLADI